MQLIAGRTEQECNERKKRRGAFWEDRYHATAIGADEHLHRYLVYIDLYMVRAGVVKRPSDWAHSGYREIREPPDRYGIIDLAALSELSGFADVADLQKVHRQWVTEALAEKRAEREARWSDAIAVGSSTFVDDVKNGLGIKATHREVVKAGQTHELREQSEIYAGHSTGKVKL